MRIRLSLTIDVDRSMKEDSQKEPPVVLEHSGSTTEILAQPRYLGFAIPEEDYGS